jgi:formamidopyrimidine-DNA glycosylase
MPELPEVETIVRQLRPRLVGHTILGASVLWPRTLAGISARAFTGGLRGARIREVRRRGKFFVIDLTRGGCPSGHLVGHLRMSGRLFLAPRDGELGKNHDRVRITLNDGNDLVFSDVRKFGRLWLTPRLDRVLGSLGPEPLAPQFTATWLADGLRARARQLKPLLLDQRFLAGLGNIYVDEALHAARLHPLTRCNRVGAAEAHRLHAAIRRVLTAAIRREGSSFDAFYRTPEGQPGRYQHQFRVYGRAGRPCRSCRAAIVRLVVGQRGTHICPRCQRLSGGHRARGRPSGR